MARKHGRTLIRVFIDSGDGKLLQYLAQKLAYCSRRIAPVRLMVDSDTCLGVPVATTVPPDSAAPGPKSIR